MSSLLLPDSGPLFSLAAGELLDVLLNFNLVITDVVKMETVDRGALPGASFEARQLAEFYKRHQDSIDVAATQLGHLADPERIPAGELSIQSLIIDLVERSPALRPTVLFEDRWFLQHRASFHQSCVLVSTTTFLHYLEEDGLIFSALQAEAKIRTRRPHFLAERWSLTGGP